MTNSEKFELDEAAEMLDLGIASLETEGPDPTAPSTDSPMPNSYTPTLR